MGPYISSTQGNVFRKNGKPCHDQMTRSCEVVEYWCQVIELLLMHKFGKTLFNCSMGNVDKKVLCRIYLVDESMSTDIVTNYKKITSKL